MTLASRPTLILALTLALAGAASAQETTTTSSTQQQTARTGTASEATATSGQAATSTVTATAEQGSEGTVSPAQATQQVEDGFHVVLGRHPREVARVLAIDPTLITNDSFVARYPEIAQYIAQHPQVRQNPHYFMRTYDVFERRPPAPFEEALETMSIVAVFSLIAFAVAWFVRTVLEQKRWNRLTRQQAEVHNKILDRFGSTSELLEYIRTPAGTKFLESAPIPLHAERPTQNTPLSRVIWSVQLGVVVAIGALGMLLVGLRLEHGQGLFAMGAIAFCIGIGFIASALVSIVLSKRLGMLQSPDAPSPNSIFDQSGPVR